MAITLLLQLYVLKTCTEKWQEDRQDVYTGSFVVYIYATEVDSLVQ